MHMIALWFIFKLVFLRLKLFRGTLGISEWSSLSAEEHLCFMAFFQAYFTPFRIDPNGKIATLQY